VAERYSAPSSDDLLGPLTQATRGLATLMVPTPPPPELARVNTLLAGAAEVDITPPPGMPKSGHSRNAQDGTGFRTRLRVRVVHLRRGRSSLALIAADLHAGSAVVHRLVARSVAATTDIPLAGLFFGATHTHAGPGQYHGSDFYNRFASNRPGFDPAYTAFLVERISEAVTTAHDIRRPARLAWGSCEVWGMTRNRSLPAYLSNDSVDDKSAGAHRRYAAINPWLHLLRVDAESTAGGMEPLAALAVFSIHGTSVGRHDPAYNADVWAYITGELASRIEATTGVRAVVGAVEGTHGDVTPAVRAGMLVYHESERVGRGIGEAAAALWERLEPALRSDAELGVAFREIDLADRDGSSSAPLTELAALTQPAIGAAKLAGAIENSTPLLDHLPPFSPGHPKPAWLARRSDHGAKWAITAPRLARLVVPPESFPNVLPLQLLRVGSLVILGLPFEVTVEAGRRLESALAAAFGEASCRAVVSSAANDYWDYLTTPEEYRAQWYEGGSNLLGPNTLGFVLTAARRLAADLASSGGAGVHDGLDTRSFRFHFRRYLPQKSGRQARRELCGEALFVDATAREDAYWQLTWRDRTPGDLTWHEPLVRVETPAVPGFVDDQGWRIGVFHLGAEAGASTHLYAARWYSPPLGPRGPHRFVVLANSGQPELRSAPFG
jgi:neutral ceramidase